jgi:hypothetical protein
MSGDIEKNHENLAKVDHPIFEPDISVIFLQELILTLFEVSVSAVWVV